MSLEGALSKRLSYIYGRKEYIFCSSHCLKEFQSNPPLYVNEGVSDEIVGVCEVCGKKMRRGEDISNATIQGKAHRFCCPVDTSVYLKSH